MKKLTLLLFIGVILSCTNLSKKEDVTENILNQIESQDSVAVRDSMITEVLEEEEGNYKSLNDIRFADFDENDWLDNDYIRCLRKYLDDYNNEKVKDDYLDQYREMLKGKFVIDNVEPFISGGLLIRFVFVDSPSHIFAAWVYSTVDEENETIAGYSVNGILYKEGNSGYTKKQILDIVKEHPELKLW